MYARVASFEGVDMERMREATEGSGEMDMPEGMKGGMVLADENSGRSIFIAFFDSTEAIQAASEQFDKMGDEIPEDVRGRRTSVDVYEVVWDNAPTRA
jgi:hypothetical protein